MCGMIKFSLSAVIAVIFSACSVVSWEYLDVSCNVAAVQEYFFEDYVAMDFSIPPDKREVEKTTRLKTDKGVVAPETLWQGSCFYIRPLTLWQKGTYYTITLEGSLRMEDGRTYPVSLERTFRYGEREGAFYLVSDTAAPDALTFVFNKAPSVVSFNEKFTLSPQTTVNTLFSEDGKTVTVTTENGWAFNTIYVWSIKDIVSDDGYITAREYGDTFYGPQDAVPPRLVTVCPVTYDLDATLWHTGLPLDGTLLEQQAVGFIFSKPMDKTSVQGGITFYPHVNGYIVKATDVSFIFVPEERYRLQKQYRITVAKTICDTSGLPLFDDTLYFFTTINNYLAVTEVRFDDTDVMPADGTVTDFTIPALNKVQTRITFETGIPASLRKKATDSVSLQALFPLSAANPVLISSFWDDSGVTLTWQGFTKTTASIEYFYIMTVKGGDGGVINGAGEYLEEDVCVVFRAL